jgi:hypothetical protein
MLALALGESEVQPTLTGLARGDMMAPLRVPVQQ